MPFDGFTIKAICSELNEELLDARIDKIYQPEKDEVILILRKYRGATCKLLISSNAQWARMHLSTEKKENPSLPPSFCMLLRKYLEGGKIKTIKQVDFERIVHIDIEALDDFREWKTKTLICEFMGKHSNIILVNPENNIIIDAIKKYGSDVSSYREVLPGKEYIKPPSQDKLNPLETSFDDFVKFIWKNSEKNIANAIFNTYSGISPKSAEEICINAGINPDMPAEECGEYELTKIYSKIQDIISSIAAKNCAPIVIYKNNKPVDFAPFKLNSLPTDRHEFFDSMNSACDAFFKEKMNRLRLESIKTNLLRNLKEYLNKCYKKQEHLEADQRKAEKNKKYKEWGELLTAYAHKYKKGDTKAVLEDFYTGEKVEIELDPRYTPVQNAQRYFKIYNKSRNALKHLESLIKANQEEIDYLESVAVAIREAENLEELEEIIEEIEKEGYIKDKNKRNKSKTKSSPRRFISSDGLEILVGRNNRQNDILTLKQADKNDLWLHTKDIPGTHVIVKLPPKIKSIHDVPDSTLEEAAALAAYYSKAKEADKVPVDYTFRINVKKPAGAKPGMVVYENYWTIMANPQDERIKKLLNNSL
ncbi:NFACT RNA binding domain-containing protein [Thermosyntropha sp.]|uniref:Rqc2 family fibronectin-binding protein n=1 Tax=Thermosyntropha sp. TaxID=2740820 RepID=UPI0025F797CF|nr:NFACT RNA binding domain-containing protein [Thermosyntropha sp.]MBO8159407.1 NFACT family protein [Thermosyntropha sp.]